MARATWNHVYIFAETGIFFQVPGSPKCPAALARAVAARGHVGGICSPAPAQKRALLRWNRTVVGWARNYPTRCAPPRPGSRVHDNPALCHGKNVARA
eukprot:1680778-Pyramimonas_sp.AAC.1